MDREVRACARAGGGGAGGAGGERCAEARGQRGRRAFEAPLFGPSLPAASAPSAAPGTHCRAVALPLSLSGQSGLMAGCCRCRRPVPRHTPCSAPLSASAGVRPDALRCVCPQLPSIPPPPLTGNPTCDPARWRGARGPGSGAGDDGAPRRLLRLVHDALLLEAGGASVSRPLGCAALWDALDARGALKGGDSQQGGGAGTAVQEARFVAAELAARGFPLAHDAKQLLARPRLLALALAWLVARMGLFSAAAARARRRAVRRTRGAPPFPADARSCPAAEHEASRRRRRAQAALANPNPDDAAMRTMLRGRLRHAAARLAALHECHARACEGLEQRQAALAEAVDAARALEPSKPNQDQVRANAWFTFALRFAPRPRNQALTCTVPIRMYQTAVADTPLRNFRNPSCAFALSRA